MKKLISLILFTVVFGALATYQIVYQPMKDEHNATKCAKTMIPENHE